VSDSIPTLDVSCLYEHASNTPPASELAAKQLAIERLADSLRDALENVGFYCLVGHQVSQILIDRVFAATRAFHAQALSAKMAVKANEHNVGYMPVNGYVSRSSRISTSSKPNLVEAFFVKRDLPADHQDVLSNKRFRCMNQWPQAFPELRHDVLEYCTAMEQLCVKMLPVYALALDLAADFFAPAFADPQITLRMSHYPPAESGDDDQFGVAPHTDSSFLTMLPQSGLPGLEIRMPSGHWLPAPAVPGSFIVNSGDMLRRWTNHRFLSTPHRVINRTPGVDRYAVPFFFDATIDYPMACLASCVDDEHPARYEPVSVMEYMVWFSNQYDHVRKHDGDAVARPGVPS
jgi:isopenicillin N synthase-like dioxygenase